MIISSLIKILEEIKRKEGDLDVRWESISHTFSVDPIVRIKSGAKVIIINS